MKKLEIELVKIFDTGLAMRIIHQDESLRNKLIADTKILYKNGKLRINSCVDPKLFSTVCYIRGTDKGKDGKVVSHVYGTKKERDAMYDFILEAVAHINKPEPLTFESIKKECVPMKHLLVDKKGGKYIYLGFNRHGYLVTDWFTGEGSTCWREANIKDCTIEEYEGETK